MNASKHQNASNSTPSKHIFPKHRPLSIISPTENQDLSIASFNRLLAQHASPLDSPDFLTSSTQFTSQLRTHDPSNPITTVLISSNLLSPQTHFSAQSPYFNTRFPGLLNLSLNSCTTGHLLHLLRGTPAQDRHVQPPITLLQNHPLRLFVVSVGDADFQSGDGHDEDSRQRIRLLLQALLRAGKPETKILLLGLFAVPSIQRTSIDGVNDFLESLAEEMNANIRSSRVIYLPPVSAVKGPGCFDENGHLTDEGYKMWLAEGLVDKMVEVTSEVDLLRGARREIVRNAGEEFLRGGTII